MIIRGKYRRSLCRDRTNSEGICLTIFRTSCILKSFRWEILKVSNDCYCWCGIIRIIETTQKTNSNEIWETRTT